MNKVLLIIPAYNEADNIVRVVEKLISNYPNFDYVVVNDGSKDDTAKLCRENGFNLVDLPLNCGLAGAFQTGMKYALENGYEYAIQYDGDGQHNPEYIEKMAEMAEKEKLDVVIGSRFVDKKKPFTARMAGSRIITACIKITTGKTIKDPTSGMRMFNKRMIKKLACNMNYGPEPDTVAYLLKCGAKIEECQVEMNDRVAGESYLNFSRSVRYMANMCASILIVQWFRGKGI
ncbi:MAG: glycosyltransferase family 2 protein [Lachnobacterium sp.]|nr:glycosyltransferase family 2 protein [Lachnobacterium sp.]